jgi:hypothetical protein
LVMAGGNIELVHSGIVPQCEGKAKRAMGQGGRGARGQLKLETRMTRRDE